MRWSARAWLTVNVDIGPYHVSVTLIIAALTDHYVALVSDRRTIWSARGRITRHYARFVDLVRIVSSR